MNREAIVAEIKRVASQDGVPPGQKRFSNLTGIPDSRWRGRFWARWSDALREAGLTPNSPNLKKDTDEILVRIAELASKLGKLPTHAELRLARTQDSSFPGYQTVLEHVGGSVDQARAIVSYCERTGLHPELRSALAASTGRDEEGSALSSDGSVYLLKSGLAYKIGRSDNIERRIKEVTVAMPESVTLVHAIRTDDPSGIERYWHNRFASKRMNGEWFKLDMSDVAAFRRRKYQ